MSISNLWKHILFSNIKNKQNIFYNVIIISKCYRRTMYFTEKWKFRIDINAVAIKNKTFLMPYFIYFMKLEIKKKSSLQTSY